MEKIDDNLVISLIYGNGDKIPSSKLRISYLKKIGIYDYLINRYKDYESLKEVLFRIKNGIEERPVCKLCGNKVNFDKNIFRKHCSPKCSAIDKETKEKRIKTNKEIYGVDNVAKDKKIKNKIKNTCLEKYGIDVYSKSEECKNKIKETCLKKYGKSSYMLTDEFKIKTSSTNLRKYGNKIYSKTNDYKEKIKNTCLEKYGVYSYLLTDEFKEKTHLTNLKKYGNEIYFKSKDSIEKRRKSLIKKYGIDSYSKTSSFIDSIKKDGKFYFTTKEFKDKVKKRNLSLYEKEFYSSTDECKNKVKKTCLEKYEVDNVSKLEETKNKIRKLYIDKFGVDSYFISDEFKKFYSENKYSILEKSYLTKTKNSSFNSSKKEDILFNLLKKIFKEVKRNYKSNCYPFCCDFYIVNEDAYIEYNGTWTHGNHPFNSNCKEDILLVEKWKNKNSKYYNNAIETWTIRDVNKRKIAEENKISYFEIWNFDEISNILNWICFVYGL